MSLFTHSFVLTFAFFLLHIKTINLFSPLFTFVLQHTLAVSRENSINSHHLSVQTCLYLKTAVSTGFYFLYTCPSRPIFLKIAVSTGLNNNLNVHIHLSISISHILFTNQCLQLYTVSSKPTVYIHIKHAVRFFGFYESITNFSKIFWVFIINWKLSVKIFFFFF